LTLSLQNCSFFLEEQSHAVQRNDLQRFAADDAIEQQEKLLEVDVSDEAVKHPRKNDSQWLDGQFFKFGH